MHSRNKVDVGLIQLQISCVAKDCLRRVAGLNLDLCKMCFISSTQSDLLSKVTPLLSSVFK